MEFVPEGEPEGCEREEVCTLYRWGRGYGACSRKAVVVLGLTTKGVKLLCGRKKQQSRSMNALVEISS
jgi:hypothetical protein